MQLVLQRTFPQQYNTSLLSTPERTGALEQYTGRGVVLAFIDSGFFPHPDLGDRVLAHVDATKSQITEGTRYRRPAWYSWHGQMTSVIAAGDGRVSAGRYRGIACDARLVLIKVSNLRQQIKEADILRGLKWLLENHRHFGIRIVNLSVGGDFHSGDPDHPIHAAVRMLAERGVIVLAAAGNGGRGFLVPPGSAPDAITVGGYDDRNTLNRADWQPYPTDYGVAYDGAAKPEIIAPAQWIVSPILPGSSVEREARWLAAMLDADDEKQVRLLLREGYADLGLTKAEVLRPNVGTFDKLQALVTKHKLIDAHHQHVDGTSVAVAITSSVVAQMLEVNPRLTPARIKAILMATAVPLSDVSRKQEGAGALNAAGAVLASFA